jgi:ribonucleoside-diphosphate reductase alpha chain
MEKSPPKRMDGQREGSPSHVVDRRGERVPVRFDAITDRNGMLCSAAFGRRLAHIEPHLPAVTQAVVERFQNGMTTHELDLLTAAVCAARSTWHRDYGDLAARILVSDLQKRTPAAYAEVVGRLGGRLSAEFEAIARRAGGEIDRRLDYARDYRFTCFGIQTMVRSYLLLGAGGEAAERPQHAYMRVALALSVGQPDGKGGEAPEEAFRERLERAFEVYDLLSTHRLTHASPTMFNAGTRWPQLSSCFLLSVDDDLEALLQVQKDAGMISKRGGGIGIALSRMRAEGAPIRSTGGQSSGLRRYIRMLNSCQLYVNQGGRRPGAYALYLEPWHADIFTFLEMGRFEGAGGASAPDLKYALWVSDLFMEAVAEELEVKAAQARGEAVPPARAAAAGDWHLFCPASAPGLDEAHGRAFRELYARYVSEGRHARVVKASEVIAEWFKTVAQKGNPYVLFKDHINAKSNLAHYRPITSSNLCVAGGTRVLTDAGQLPIGALADQAVRVWNGAEWSAVTVRQTAPAAALVRVVLDSGAALVCTPGHKFYDVRGAELRAGALAPGTRLEEAAAWPVVGGGPPLAHAYTHGFYAAVGHLDRGRPAVHLPGDLRAVLADPRFELDEEGPAAVRADGGLGRTTVLLPPGLPPKSAVPVNAALGSRLRWFEGYCDGAACVARPGSSPTLQAWSTELDFLRQVRLMLQTMGCNPKISGGRLARAAGVRGRGDESRGAWRLLVDETDLWTLKGLGFAPARLDCAGGAPPPHRGARRSAQVVSVTPLEEAAPTFCFTEPLRGRGVFEGVLAGNCAEITIPCFYEEGRPDEAEYGTCNLAAIPLASFVRPDARARNRGRVRVDWPGLIATAGAAVRNLDNIIDVSLHPVAASRRSDEKHRPVALGVIGLADVLAQFRYAYGEPSALALDRALHAAIYFGAMRSSSALGEERGNFASFEGSASQRGLLQPDLWVRAGHLEEGWEDGVAATTGGALSPGMWADLRRRCSRHLRNAYVTADMPTATSSQATGQNECFEPFTSNLYTRRTLAGEFTLLNPHLLSELEALGLWDEEMRRALIGAAGSVQGIRRVPPDLRWRFRTAREIDQRLLTRHAKARNPFLSQTQSLNYYFSEPRLKDALTVLLLGWREGLTTGSYYIHTQPAAGAQKTSIFSSSPARRAEKGVEPPGGGSCPPGAREDCQASSV